MSDTSKMSRRDWFRLLPCRPESETPTDIVPVATGNTATHSIGASSQCLQTIPHPENHDGMNLAELPPMREAFLSEEQVRQLFADIENLASDILLMQRLVRSARTTVSSARTAEQLRLAQQSLLSGAISRVQIRYHWQASHWIDTLESHDTGIRLVRIAHDPAAFASRAASIRP